MIVKKTPTNYTKQRLEYIFAVLASMFAALGLFLRKRFTTPSQMIFELDEQDVLAMVKDGGAVQFPNIKLNGTAIVTIPVKQVFDDPQVG